MESLSGILKGFRLTEKTNLLSTSRNQYVFEVALSATKGQICRAIREEFGVRPEGVNVLRQKGKLKRCRISKKHTVPTRKPEIKKAIVALRAGDRIEIL
jgi:large subunit ribosomal protein L23